MLMVHMKLPTVEFVLCWHACDKNMLRIRRSTDKAPHRGLVVIQWREGHLLPTWVWKKKKLANISTECSSCHQGESIIPASSFTLALMTTGAFNWNVGRLFSKLKLVTDNLLVIYAAANWEATESCDSNCNHWWWKVKLIALHTWGRQASVK